MPEGTQAAGEAGATTTTITATAQDDERIAALVRGTIGKVLPTALEAALAPLREQFAPKPEAPKTPAAGAGGAASDPLATRLAELEAQLTREREATARERQATREAQAFAELRAELGGKVRPDAVDAVAKLLFHADKNVRVGKDGSVRFHLGDEEYSLADGVGAYLRSPAASLFLPAPGYAQKKPIPGRPPERPAGAGARPAETPEERTRRQIAALEAKVGRRIL